jgi:hypothetical protein
MPHHLFNENSLRSICPYCQSDLSENSWGSEFEGNKHYKISECGCGSKIHLEVGFDGSGHDSWEDITKPYIEEKEEEPKSIEDKI